MNAEMQLKVMALIDGELQADEAREIEALLKTDSTAAALAGELGWVKSAVAGHEPMRGVTDTREFYWSKIARGIEVSEAVASRREVTPGLSATWWYRLLVPTAGVATVVLALTFANQPPATVGEGVSPEARPAPVKESADANVYSFYDENQKMQVIWVYSEETSEFQSPTLDTGLESNDKF